VEVAAQVTRDDGRYAAFGVGCVLLLAAAVITGWRSLADDGMLAGLADCLLLMVVYVVRGIWILIGLSMALLVLVLGLGRRFTGRTRQEAVTALGSAAGATAGFALLTGALLAASGAAVHTLTLTWAKAGTKHIPWCLSRAVDWTPTVSNCPPSARADPWSTSSPSAVRWISSMPDGCPSNSRGRATWVRTRRASSTASPDHGSTSWDRPT
jgi:hypothetical protein